MCKVRNRTTLCECGHTYTKRERKQCSGYRKNGVCFGLNMSELTENAVTTKCIECTKGFVEMYTNEHSSDDSDGAWEENESSQNEVAQYAAMQAKYTALLNQHNEKMKEYMRKEKMYEEEKATLAKNIDDAVNNIENLNMSETANHRQSLNNSLAESLNEIVEYNTRKRAAASERTKHVQEQSLQEICELRKKIDLVKMYLDNEKPTYFC